MTPHEFLEALTNTVAVKEGGTPHGMSADEKAVDCGMKAAFSTAGKFGPSVFPMQFTDANGKVTVIGTRAGTVFHAINEMTRSGVPVASLPAAKVFAEVDVAVEAGLFAFKRYVEENKGDLDYLGTTLAVERPFEGRISGQLRTGRADRVVRVSQEQADRWAAHGVFFANPGLYLWDYKLLKAVTVKDAEKYVRSLQPLAYLDLYEQTTGERPEGFIFELVSRADKPKYSRLLAIVANTPGKSLVLEHAVRLSTRRRAEGDAVPTHCDSQYSPCPFMKVCPRFGTAEQHKDLIANYAKQHTFIDEDE